MTHIHTQPPQLTDITHADHESFTTERYDVAILGGGQAKVSPQTSVLAQGPGLSQSLVLAL